MDTLMHSILKIKLIAIIFLFSATCNASQIKLPTDKKLISFLNELFDNNAEFTKTHDTKYFDKFRDIFVFLVRYFLYFR